MGVKKCGECEHVVPNSAIRNTCAEHPKASLIKVKLCILGQEICQITEDG